MSGFSNKVQGHFKNHAKKSGPVWAGPESPENNGGITFSLLSRFLVCPERFRCLVVDGLKTSEGFNHKLEFGSMWHACEEAHAANLPFEIALGKYVDELCHRYPMDRERIAHWGWMTQTKFPLYIAYWKDHPDVLKRVPVEQEHAFRVQYILPSGRSVYLRGKRDAVDLIDNHVYLGENKTKSRIDEIQLKRQLTFDLQTMMYLTALQEERHYLGDNTIKARTSYMKGKERHFYPIGGVRYNVIRRSEHRVGKKETEETFCERLAGIISEAPHEWFMRWKVEISQQDIDRFCRECLDPILERLCDWWDWVGKLKQEPFDVKGSGGIHYRFPYGVYNPMLEGGQSDLDSYIDSGSEVGLQRVEDLFPELS